MLTLKAFGEDGYVLYGSTMDTIEYVCGIDVGRMADGVRYISKDECTEALLTSIESRYKLLVWV